MENQKCYTIYIHIFPNSKTYVGLTKQRVENRWANGEGYKNQPVYEPIKFYGWENIKHIIIKEGLTKEEAQELEKELIKKYDSINFGYNYSEGGGTGGESWNVFEYNNQKYSANELAELSPLDNLTGHDITNRINEHGWNIEKAITQPKKNRHILFEYEGQVYNSNTIINICCNKSLTHNDITDRYRNGWSVEEIIHIPKGTTRKQFYDNNLK